MPNAYIRLHSSNSLVGKLIKWQTGGDVSHASIEVLSEGYEAREFVGVRQFNLLAEHPDDIVLVLQVALTNAEAINLRYWLKAQLHKKYDYIQVLRFITRQKECKTSQNVYFCSELVLAGLQYIKKDLINIEPWRCSPNILTYIPRSLVTDVTKGYLASLASRT